MTNYAKLNAMQGKRLKTPAKVVSFLLLILTVVACQIGPDYIRPDLAEKKDWSNRFAKTIDPSEIIRVNWWTNFRDPFLDDLVRAAISGNIDLKILLGRIQESGATIKESKADLLPTVDLSASAEFSESVPEGSSSSRAQQSFDIRAGVSWELDIWGKKRSGYLASKASYKASQADYRAGYLKLVSEMARTYFKIREMDDKLFLKEKFYQDNQKKLTIYRNQYTEGIIPDWKVSRQEAEVKGLMQELLELKRRRKLFENRMATLLGKPAGDIKIPKGQLRKNLLPVEVPAGLPSELLSRRPDIVSAEYRLIKASHQLGEAQAARLPSISLTGSAGLVSTTLSTLLNQWALGIVPQILAPVFDGGRLKAKAEISKTRVQIAEDEYRKTVMKAFEEVENALINLDSRSRQSKVIEEKVESLLKVRAQTMAQFQLGLISQLEILDIENELHNSEILLIEMHRLLLDDTVTLYKALGGGWHKEKSVSSPK